MAHVQHGQLAVVCRALNVSSRDQEKGLALFTAEKKFSCGKPCFIGHKKREDIQKKIKKEQRACIVMYHSLSYFTPLVSPSPTCTGGRITVYLKHD